MANKELKFVNLGIDAGATAGWAITTCSDVSACTMHGEVKTPQQRMEVIKLANAQAKKTKLPLVVSAEEWPGRWPSYKSAMGMGRNWGRWLDNIELVLGIKESKILRFSFNKWRYGLWEPDIVRAASKEKNGYKKLAMSYTNVSKHNEAEAICISVYTQLDAESLEVVKYMR